MTPVFYTAGNTPALNFGIRLLKDAGISFSSLPCPQVTHLLLPVPSLESDGSIKGGGDLALLMSQLPCDITVIGGNLPALACPVIDLMQDPEYVARNAAITAHCALIPAMTRLECTLEGCPVLVVGWGRIGKCLARLLRGLDAQVTVAARKPADRAMLEALGYRATDMVNIKVSDYRIIYNTVPQMLLPQGADCLCIDLASKPGIGGDNVLWARGLPGKDAPESSGRLIAETVLRLL
ncbi:MAG: hypothetical protein E7437_06770 [Ruminococcaceae bacterium]|nr:hypothetical protein [Oscillospiraceae bacterium]